MLLNYKKILPGLVCVWEGSSFSGVTNISFSSHCFGMCVCGGGGLAYLALSSIILLNSFSEDYALNTISTEKAKEKCVPVCVFSKSL